MFSPASYYPAYIFSTLLISCIYTIYLNKHSNTFLEKNNNSPFILLYVVLFIILVGLRPVSGYYFGDTINYASSYYALQANTAFYDPDSSDWLFSWLMSTCALFMDVHGFFLLVEAGYVLLILWACKRLISNNATLAIIFCFGAFSFFSYGTNGIRNGLACSFVILALSFIKGKTRDQVIAGILCFVAFSIHKSTALPILCMIISCFYQKTKVIYSFWFFSIIISAVAGSFVENIFSGLGFDDRLDNYLTNREYDDQFSSVGFRWDFLLYSAMPILLGWYVVFKEKIYDSQYLLLLHTYILANAFWVMLIRASFSNRFAYLSWFMYPIVLAYPLLMLPIWKNQGKKVGLILMAHVLFTFLMWIKG
ncbi:EpsG family protein [Dysgonomonas sp. 511]|uniref:EpsG family protein n=1 Tax=Dysgonomonas sp. 511 TaxID=2302930 RepID=UPI0013D1FAEB|nr:EpsG family protein [Dysgonomonas sp. 511]NDV78856.1 EpsG family protein [Dysgonomonas sp. 511]